MIFALIWGILIFVRFLGYAGLPQAFAEWIVTLPFPPIIIMIGILLGYAVLGMFMDAIGMLLLTLPVVYPAVIALGYDPIWCGARLVVILEMSLISPPLGLNVFVVKGISGGVPMADIFKGVLPFWGAMMVCAILLIAFPEIALFLPKTMIR